MTGKGLGPGGYLIQEGKVDRCTSRARKKMSVAQRINSLERVHEKDSANILIKKEGKRLKQLVCSFLAFIRLARINPDG